MQSAADYTGGCIRRQANDPRAIAEVLLETRVAPGDVSRGTRQPHRGGWTANTRRSASTRELDGRRPGDPENPQRLGRVQCCRIAYLQNQLNRRARGRSRTATGPSDSSRQVGQGSARECAIAAQPRIGGLHQGRDKKGRRANSRGCCSLRARCLASRRRIVTQEAGAAEGEQGLVGPLHLHDAWVTLANSRAGRRREGRKPVSRRSVSTRG